MDRYFKNPWNALCQLFVTQCHVSKREEKKSELIETSLSTGGSAVVDSKSFLAQIESQTPVFDACLKRCIAGSRKNPSETAVFSHF